MEQLPTRVYLSRDEMLKRVARFKDLKGFDGGLPDSKMPGCERTLYNVIGFQPPEGIGENAYLAGRRPTPHASPPSRSAKASTSATARPSPATGPRCTITTPTRLSSP